MNSKLGMLLCDLAQEGEGGACGLLKTHLDHSLFKGMGLGISGE